IAVDAMKVYYLTNSGSIESILKGGGSQMVVVPPGMGSGNGSLVLDGDTFYYTVGPSLRKAPVFGGSFTDLSNRVNQGGNQQGRLAVDDTYVYFLATGQDQGAPTVGAVPKAGGALQTVATGKGNIGSIAAAGKGSVVFTDLYAFGTTKLDVNLAVVG